MARWQPARADVIADYAREVLEVHPRGRLVVGIDGIEQVGEGDAPSSREAFADDLAEAFRRVGVPAVCVHMGRFAVADAASPDQLVDEDAFRSAVLAPYRAGAPVQIAESAAIGAGAGTRVLEPPERAVMVVSGAFLHVGDLAGIWHTSAWVQLPRVVAAQRDADRRAGMDPAVWATLVETAFRRLDARKLANATFDLADAAHPRRRFEDAC